MPAIHIQDVKATGYDPYEYFFTTQVPPGGRTCSHRLVGPRAGDLLAEA